MNLNLQNKVAVITGGSIGIGLAVAKSLAAEGVHLALCARNDERLQKEAATIREAFDVEVLAKTCDVTKVPEINNFIQAVDETFNGADISSTMLVLVPMRKS